MDVVNADGKQMAALRTNIVTGAECGDQQPYLLIDSQPMQALAEPGAADQSPPRYVFEARGDFGAAEASPPTYASYGITMMPEETGPTSCPMFQLFLWPPSGALFGQAYDPGKNTTPGDPGLPYLEKAKLYASTAEYQDVRKMITSLRPAGNGEATGSVDGTGEVAGLDDAGLDSGQVPVAVTVFADRRCRRGIPAAALPGPRVAADFPDQPGAGALAHGHDAVRRLALVVECCGNRQHGPVGGEKPEPYIGFRVGEDFELSSHCLVLV